MTEKRDEEYCESLPAEYIIIQDWETVSALMRSHLRLCCHKNKANHQYH